MREIKETKFVCKKCGHFWYVSKLDEVGKASHQCTACANPCCFFLTSPYYKNIHTSHCPKCNSSNINKVIIKHQIKSVDLLLSSMEINFFQKISLGFLNFYQRKISPVLQQRGVKCRFTPSCSDYSKIVFCKYGVLKGFYLTVKRIFSCRPSNTGSCINYPV